METDRIKDLDHQIDIQLELIKLGYLEHLGPAFIEDHLKKIEYFTEQKFEIQADECHK